MSLENLAELERLATETSTDKRRELLRRITDLFLITADSQAETETRLFDDVLGRIAFDLEAQIRKELSERLARQKNAPPNLIDRLARDEIAVARPILENSPCLEDQQLVSIASTHGQDHLHAIARRENIGETVTDVIVARGEDRVLECVSENTSARFSEKGFSTLVEKSADNETLQLTLGNRSDMPEKLRDQLARNIAERLSTTMLPQAAGVSDAHLEETLKMKLELVGLNSPVFQDARTYIDHLINNNRLNEKTLADLAKADRREETILALAHLTGIPEKTAVNIISNGQIQPLAIVCKANRFSQSTFAAILNLVAREKNLPSQNVIRIIKHYDTMEEAAVQRVMRFLKVRMAASGGKTVNRQAGLIK